MKVGSLVKRKPKWGEWVKHNPWMLTEKDLEIGIIVKLHEWNETIVAVLWPNSSSGWIKKQSLVTVNENG